MIDLNCKEDAVVVLRRGVLTWEDGPMMAQATGPVTVVLP